MAGTMYAPMTLSQELDALVEQGAEYAPFKPYVGQRVILRLSGECRATPHPDSWLGVFGEPFHVGQHSGMVGTVTRMAPDLEPHMLDHAPHAGHTVEVRIDLIVDGAPTWRRVLLAPAELDPPRADAHREPGEGT